MLTGTAPFSASDWPLIVLLGLPPLFVGEIYKAVTGRAPSPGTPAGT